MNLSNNGHFVAKVRIANFCGLSLGTKNVLNLTAIDIAKCLQEIRKYSDFPYVYLLSRAAFLEQSICVLEVSRTLGCSVWSSFFRVALPLARPAIVAGLSLAMMETLADYGMVSFFGLGVFTTGIFRTWFGLGDSAAAAKLASLLLMFVFATVWLPSTVARIWSSEILFHFWRVFRTAALCVSPLTVVTDALEGLLRRLAGETEEPNEEDAFLCDSCGFSPGVCARSWSRHPVRPGCDRGDSLPQ